MPKPVHALVGADLFLQLQVMRDIMRAAGVDAQRITFDGETAELADVLDELRSFAMFSSSKVVIVREADDFVSRFRQQLEQYVSRPAPDSTLILRLASLPKVQRIYKLIAANGQIHECEAPKALRPWIIAQAKNIHKLRLGAEEAGLLEELVGKDLGRLDNELAKLALQSQTGAADAALIRSSVAFQREQEMWDMTNEVAAGRVADAVKRWRQLVQLDPSTEYRAVTWLMMWLEDAQAMAGNPQGFKNAWKYKDRLPQFKRTVEAIGRHRLGQLVELLAEVDYRSKSGLGNMADNVERFLLAVNPAPVSGAGVRMR